MHSRIFQISSEPIKNFITEERYDDNFVGEIADYVQDIYEDNWKDEWEWLCKYAHGAIEIKNAKLTIIDKQKYFEDHYTEFMGLIDKAAKMNLEQFMSNDENAIEMPGMNGNTYKTNSGYLVSYINYVFDDKFGYYVDDNDEYAGKETFDTFMRRVNNGDMFYLGSVIDYHF